MTGAVLDELNYQFLRRLKNEGLITIKELYIDGTKIEANAKRCTFVWHGTLNYHLVGLLDTIDEIYKKYNACLDEHGVCYEKKSCSHGGNLQQNSCYVILYPAQQIR